MAASVEVNSSNLGSSLQSLLMCDDITPGAAASYEICKTIYLWHPLGRKMTETPVKMALSLGREITIGVGPEEDLKKAFLDQEKKDEVAKTIANLGTQARVYGIASLAIKEEDVKDNEPLDFKTLSDTSISFNVLDPLNTAGSLVLNQNPNSIDYQKHSSIAVNGIPYHRSRTVTLMHEQPIYIAYTSSAFGFVGRSVYQRALFPLKSFVNTMITDDMVARKAGLLVATLKMAGSIVDAVMTAAAAFKRRVLKLGQTENVLSISEGEAVQSIDLTNIDGAMISARRNILMNVASASDMPARILNHETFAEGFGEGTEDAKAEALFVDDIRAWLTPAYDFLDMVTMRRAWNERFFKSLQSKYPELKGKKYEECFYEWQNAFIVKWPSLLREPESQMVMIDDTKMKALIAMAQVFEPLIDPENKTKLLMWIEDQINSTSRLFSVPLELDYDSLGEYMQEQKEKGDMIGSEDEDEPKAAPPFSARDSAVAAYLGNSKYDDGEMRKRITSIEDHLRKRNRV